MNLPDATRMKYVELVRREVWKLLPYWMWRHMVYWTYTEVSEDPVASVVRADVDVLCNLEECSLET
jgi:hypothetical protein